MNNSISQKHRSLCILFAVIGGALGWHHYYVGNWGRGLRNGLLTITLVGLPIVIVLNLIDIFKVIVGEFRDSQGQIIQRW